MRKLILDGLYYGAVLAALCIGDHYAGFLGFLVAGTAVCGGLLAVSRRPPRQEPPVDILPAPSSRVPVVIRT